MSTLEKFNNALSELEKQQGDKIAVADIRQLVASTFATVPAVTAAPTVTGPVSAAPTGAQCEATTKKDNKQCTKKAQNKGPDGKCYCPQHLRIAFPDSAPAPAAAASSSSSTPAKKASPKTTVGKGSLTVTCTHQITGKNARQCAAAGKNLGPDGQYYCGTHFKKFAKGTAVAGVKANDAKAESKIAVSMTQPAPQMNNELGLAVDQNGIAYLNDYKGMGICVCGLVVNGVVVDTTPDTEKFVGEFGLEVIPPEAREEIRKMTPEQRLVYMNGVPETSA